MSAYDDYMSIAKRHAQTGNLRGALESLRSAQDIDDNDKVRRRIKKIQEAMEDESENETTDEEREEEDSKEGSRDDSGFQDLQNGLKIDQNLYNRLYPHQVEGVQFMWNNIHCRGVNGGMLSDDMGLGKTIQVSAFISALIDMGEAKRFIIMVPNSLVANWEKELGIWCPAINVFKYTGEFHQTSTYYATSNGTKVDSGIVGNIWYCCNVCRAPQFDWDWYQVHVGLRHPRRSS